MQPFSNLIIKRLGKVDTYIGRKMKKEKKTEIIRMLKFVIFSISAGVIEIVTFTLLNTFTGWKYWPCYLTALILSVVWNFTLNREFTFRSSGNVPVAIIKVAVFYAVFTPASTIAGNYLAEDAGWNEYLVTACNMLCNFVLEYLYDTFVVFGKTIDTKIKQEKIADSK